MLFFAVLRSSLVSLTSCSHTHRRAIYYYLLSPQSHRHTRLLLTLLLLLSSPTLLAYPFFITFLFPYPTGVPTSGHYIMSLLPHYRARICGKTGQSWNEWPTGDGGLSSRSCSDLLWRDFSSRSSRPSSDGSSPQDPSGWSKEVLFLNLPSGTS